MKYRKKPVVIDAIQFTGSNLKELHDLLGLTEGFGLATSGKSFLLITIEGDVRVRIGDYIIKGIEDEIYTCNADIFEKIYEKVE